MFLRGCSSCPSSSSTPASLPVISSKPIIRTGHRKPREASDIFPHRLISFLTLTAKFHLPLRVCSFPVCLSTSFQRPSSFFFSSFFRSYLAEVLVIDVSSRFSAHRFSCGSTWSVSFPQRIQLSGGLLRCSSRGQVRSSGRRYLLPSFLRLAKILLMMSSM